MAPTPRISSSSRRESYLPSLGVYGFDSVEPIILAALVTQDPLLLIGESGTGKTFLLNSVSEALGIEHRHYNASLLSFDDLVGFPYPDPERASVKFLETPATVWGAESVLVDEISRCKPEHQNRLFSLIHERRLQGIALDSLRFRWAAMNPCSSDQDSQGGYSGSEPLDPALGDRFGLIVNVGDWMDLNKADRKHVANPAGEGKRADDGGRLRDQLALWRAAFQQSIEVCPEEIIDYATAAVTTLNSHSVRVSPRRARLLSRTLIAAEIVTGRRVEAIYETALACSLPHGSWGVVIDPLVVKLTHRAAWDSSMLSDSRKWVHRFHLETSLSSKLQLLLDVAPDPDVATQAVCELLAREPKERGAAFAFAIYPAAAKGLNVAGREGVNELGKLALSILDVNGKVTWQERFSEQRSTHPEIARFARVLTRLRGARKERAQQFFNFCVVSKLVPDDPAALESEIEGCVQLVKTHLKRPVA